MSILELAQKTGISTSHLKKIEEDKYSYPSVQKLEQIANVLNIPVQLLLGPQTSQEKETELDDVWIEVVKEAMESGVSKEQFKAFIENKKRERDDE